MNISCFIKFKNSVSLNLIFVSGVGVNTHDQSGLKGYDNTLVHKSFVLSNSYLWWNSGKVAFIKSIEINQLHS